MAATLPQIDGEIEKMASSHDKVSAIENSSFSSLKMINSDMGWFFEASKMFLRIQQKFVRSSSSNLTLSLADGWRQIHFTVKPRPPAPVIWKQRIRWRTKSVESLLLVVLVIDRLFNRPKWARSCTLDWWLKHQDVSYSAFNRVHDDGKNV